MAEKQVTINRDGVCPKCGSTKAEKIADVAPINGITFSRLLRCECRQIRGGN